MLLPRIIPCLLVRNNGLVKTLHFSDEKYVGDPLNAVRIFNEKEVDEILVLDIDATVRKQELNYSLIGNLATECRMPLCYGGGVHTVEQVQKIVGLGVEKVAISSYALNNPEFITQAAEKVGSQSIVVVLDIVRSKLTSKYQVRTHNAKVKVKTGLKEFVRMAADLGVGELVINNVDRDGTMAGYDLDLIDLVRSNTRLPITALGGAGSHEDIQSLVERFGIIGAAAGSLFVFKGPYRAVLINYPNRTTKAGIFTSS